MESFLNKLIESEEFSKLTNLSINYLNFYMIFKINNSIYCSHCNDYSYI